MLRFIALLYPRKVRDNFEKLLRYCYIQTEIDTYLSFMTLISLVLSLFVSLLIRIFVDFSFTILLISTFVLALASIHTYLILAADGRGRFVEDLLPDVLQLMAANLRAGMTVDRAFLLSVLAEFGRVQDEVKRVGTEIATGKELEVALKELAVRYRSDKLQKTVSLIISGVESGGQIADLLEQTGSNLRQQKLSEQRIRSNVLVYVIFIFSAISFGAPMLFALSSFLIEVITNIFSKIELPPPSVAAQLPFTMSKVTLEPSFVNTYTLVSLVITSFMGSLVLGLIAKGKESEGFKFFPILILMTISIFFLVKFVISTMLSSFFTF